MNNEIPGTSPCPINPSAKAAGQTPGACRNQTGRGHGQWHTIAEAAASLGVHPRTIERRASAGRLRKRTVDGSPQVLVADSDLPGKAGGMSGADRGMRGDTAAVTEAIDAMVGQSQRQLVQAGGAVEGWKIATERVDAELARTRRSGQLAWSAVMALAVTLLIGTWWSTNAITGTQSGLAAEKQQGVAIAEQFANLRADAQAQASTLRQQLAGRAAEADRLATEASRIAAERDRLRDELQVLAAEKQRLGAAESDTSSIGP